MDHVKKILKEELSKRDKLKARVKEIFLERVPEGDTSIGPIKEMGFDYPGMEEDLREVAIEWGNELISRMKAITPKSNPEARFIKMFDGLYVDAMFEKYPKSIFFFKGNPSSPEYWFELVDSWLLCSIPRVLKVLEGEYSMEYGDVKQLIKPLLEEAFGMRSVNPLSNYADCISEVVADFKSRNNQ